MDTTHCKKEIIELHRFFEEWATAKIPKTGQQLQRLSGVLAPEFVIITPGAEKIKRNSLLGMIRKGYGRYRENPDAYKIWIEDVQTRILGENSYLSTYLEGQKINDEIKVRLSTVIFTKEETASNGLLWQHVHETWKPNS